MRKDITTVKDLKDFIDFYLTHGKETDEIKLIDDGVRSAFFDVECLVSTKFERKIDDYGHYESPVNVLALTFNRFREV